MNLRLDSFHHAEGEAVHSPVEASHASHMVHIMKISQLQAYISQAKAKLSQLARETEAVRRRVKAQASIHRSSGVATYTQAEVNDLLSLIVLLEEENSQLRALSAIPVEIERLKAELQDSPKPDFTVKELQVLNSTLKSDLSDALVRLKEAENRLSQASVIEKSPHETPREDIVVSMEANYQEQFSSAKSGSPASPASRLNTVAKPLFSATKNKTSPRRAPPKLSFSPAKPKSKTRGYSPTFLRALKGRHMLESTSPVRPKLKLSEDAFADCFPEECEGIVAGNRRVS